MYNHFIRKTQFPFIYHKYMHKNLENFESTIDIRLINNYMYH